MTSAATFVERYKGVKNMVSLLLLQKRDAKHVFDTLVYEFGYGDLAIELSNLLKKKGLDVGQWSDWQANGTCVSQCGLSTRKMWRTCASGTNCLGVSEGVEVCSEPPFDKVEFEACEEKFGNNTLPESDAPQIPLENALETLCHGNTRRPLFDYFRITNKHTGLTLAHT